GRLELLVLRTRTVHLGLRDLRRLTHVDRGGDHVRPEVHRVHDRRGQGAGRAGGDLLAVHVRGVELAGLPDRHDPGIRCHADETETLAPGVRADDPGGQRAVPVAVVGAVAVRRVDVVTAAGQPAGQQRVRVHPGVYHRDADSLSGG